MCARRNRIIADVLSLFLSFLIQADHEQSRAAMWLRLAIMHASLDTDIHGGVERDGPVQCARALPGFVPILPFGSRENSVLVGCMRNAANEREK